MAERSFRILQSSLVCPLCKGKLEFALDVVECTDCFDLLPPHALENEGSKWGEPQREMEEWYEDLILEPDGACNCFVNDYAPYAPVMAALSGKVLDVGGDIGVVRHYLPRDTQYTAGDPSLNRLEAEWSTLAEYFPCLRAMPNFVRGVGECLLFPAQTLDAVLSFWNYRLRLRRSSANTRTNPCGVGARRSAA